VGKGRLTRGSLNILPLVPLIAWNVGQQVAAPLDFGNLVKDGVAGLLKGARTYPRQSPVPLAAFVKYCIKGAILDGLRSETPTARRRPSGRRCVPNTRSIRTETRSAGTREAERGDEFFVSLFGLRGFMEDSRESALQLSEMREGDE
jgi:DNA-directed RNA polymerase specialized sigma subunit